ncbi:MAG: sulfite exporter TauE/SafE family protein [Candidatus Dormibacteraceae bacterium]
MNPALGAAILLGAGVVAGTVGTAGGITSLVSYPALLLVGVPAFPAAIVNTVSVVACLPGSALMSRPELVGRARWVGRWAIVTVVGGVAGAVLLLTTPPGVFERLVPFLLVAGSAALLLQNRLIQLADARLGQAARVLLPVGLILISVYNGYFGAGAGVLTLVLMLVLVEHRIALANALKNVLIGIASIVAAVTFVLLGHVRWEDVVPLAVGLFLGSMLGPVVARKLPARLLRWLVALMGFGFAVRLWVVPL